MSLSILPRLLVLAAAMLTVAEPLCVFCGTDGQVANLLAESEDAEEEQPRDDTFVLGWVPIVETALQSSTASITLSLIDAPIICGPHNERGPPMV